MTADAMSEYERKAWQDLQEHWTTKAESKKQRSNKLSKVTRGAKQVVEASAAKAARASKSLPEPARNAMQRITVVPAKQVAKGVTSLLDLVTDWSAELTNPEEVLKYHRQKGREVHTLADIRNLDLKHADELVRRLSLKWASIGAAEGAAMGSLAFIPVAGGAAAITLDVVVVQVLSRAIATRIAYAYGFDAFAPATEEVIQRIVRKAFLEQSAKAGVNHQVLISSQALKGRVNWSAKLRADHTLVAGVEKFMLAFTKKGHVTVASVTKAIPFVAVVASSGTNAYVLRSVATHGKQYARTLFLAEKYGLPVPAGLAQMAVDPVIEASWVIPETDDVANR